ncbi:MAG: lamin tail domain-containing protein [Polyangiaceae bacterium]
MHARTWRMAFGYAAFFAPLASACALGVAAPAVETTPDATVDTPVERKDASVVRDATVSDASKDDDTGAVDAGKPDTGFVKDSGSDAKDAAKDVVTVDASGPTCTTLSINEIQTAGTTASDEFVELFNPGASACNVVGWKLIYRSAAGASDVTMFSGGTFSIPAGGFAVLGGADFVGTKAGALMSGLAAAGGQLQLRDAANAVFSSLGYGTANGAFVRGTPAPAPGASESIGRIVDGQDTQDNFADFFVSTAPTPGAANQ